MISVTHLYLGGQSRYPFLLLSRQLHFVPLAPCGVTTSIAAAVLHL